MSVDQALLNGESRFYCSGLFYTCTWDIASMSYEICRSSPSGEMVCIHYSHKKALIDKFADVEQMLHNLERERENLSPGATLQPAKSRKQIASEERDQHVNEQLSKPRRRIG